MLQIILDQGKLPSITSSYRDNPMEVNFFTHNCSVTPETTKHQKLYFHFMPEEIKKLYNEKKLKEQKAMKELREKDQ